MTNIQIIGAIMMATGLPVPDVAKEHGYSKHTFYRVINGERDIEPVKEIISKITGKTISDLWPEENKNTPTPAGRNGSSVGDGGRAPDPSRG